MFRMTLQRKTLGTIALAFLTLILALFFISNLIVLGGFSQQEEYEVREDMTRVGNVLDKYLKLLQSFTSEWSHRDDTYTYIVDHNQEYFDTNLADSVTDPFMAENNLNLLWYVDSHALTVFIKVFDYEAGENLPIPAGLQEHVYPGSLLINHPDVDNSLTGILPLDGTPLLFVSQPVVTSLGEGPARGTLIFGRFLNDSSLQRLGDTALVNVIFHVVGDPQMPADSRQALQTLTNQPSNNYPVQVLGSNSIAAYETLNDVYGKPALILRVEASRDVYNKGQQTLQYFMLTLLAVGLVFGLTIWLLLKRLVLVRLARLKDEVSSISTSHDVSTRVTAAGDDELSSLATSINVMLSTLERSQEEQKAIEKRFLTVFNVNPAVQSLSRLSDRRLIAVNEAFVRLIGYSQEEAMGHSSLELDIWKYPSQRTDMLAALRHHDIIQNMEVVLRSKLGVERTYLLSAGLVNIGGEECVLSSAIDITERNQTEEALRLSDEILKRVGSLVLVSDKEGLITYVSPSIEVFLGYKPEEVLGMGWWQIRNGEAASRMDEKERIRLSTVGESVIPAGPYERTIMARDGAQHTILWQDAKGPGGQLIGVGQDITDRVRAEESRTAKNVAERANRAKSEFLSRMSHELRTPLNAVLGFAQVLKMDELTDEQTESLDLILAGGRHLLDLINEVLDIASIEAGRMSLCVEPVDIEATLDECINIMRPLADERNITIQPLLMSKECCAEHVMADRQRLKQLVLNLLSNGIKYNHAGGTVTLTCAEQMKVDRGDGAHPGGERGNRSGSSIRIMVSDTGPGIRHDMMDKLFAPFERLGAEQSQIEGTGLGLSLSKRLVEAMQGTIGVESKVGEGSTFWIELPAVDSPAEKPANLDTVELWETIPAITGARTVLYIEDTLSNLQLVERILKNQEVRLITTMQGRMGIELAAQHHPDMILLDLQLPDMGGEEVLRKLRENPVTRDIPVVILSADATERQIERLYMAGARDYLTKPIDILKFTNVLNHILNETPVAETKPMPAS